MKQQANTIILEMSGVDKDDISDFRCGEGKIFRRVEAILDQLKEEGQVDENAQPVIALVKKKKESSGLLG